MMQEQSQFFAILHFDFVDAYCFPDILIPYITDLLKREKMKSTI